MTTSMFIRSYRGDREWLTYCLRALEKRASGFLETVVVLPVGDELHFGGYDFRGARVEWVNDIACDGYLAQQACKLEADLVCRGDVVMFFDSDCIAHTPFRPEQFTVGGKVRQLVRYWDSVGDAKMWEPVVEDALGEKPKFEFMATHPLVYWRDSIRQCREFLDGRHGSMRDYVKGRPAKHFSEFNVLGAFCHLYEPHRYDWRLADPAADGYPRPFKQFWSWDGIHKHVPEVEGMLV